MLFLLLPLVIRVDFQVHDDERVCGEYPGVCWEFWHGESLDECQVVFDIVAHKVLTQVRVKHVIHAIYYELDFLIDVIRDVRHVELETRENLLNIRD